MRTIVPENAEEAAAAVRAHPCVVPQGNLTKAPLAAGSTGAVRLDASHLTGVTEYEPAEFTFTARAGTPLKVIERMLAGERQYMPFDPPLAVAGATIGGTIAAGLSGPGRLRYGGVRDFIIGVRFIDGSGRLVRGGGRVVKNAAGFDLPKLMVGSMGRLGVIVDATFKVFPAPHAYRTVRVACDDLHDALACLTRLSRLPLELDALEMEPPATLFVRVSGDGASLAEHAARIGEAADRTHEYLDEGAEQAYWSRARSFDWCPPDRLLIKVPLTPSRVPALDRSLARHDVSRRYGVAANVAWLGWPADHPLDALDLTGLVGLIIRGPVRGDSGQRRPTSAPEPRAWPFVGRVTDRAEPFARRIKEALDPERRLPSLS